MMTKKLKKRNAIWNALRARREYQAQPTHDWPPCLRALEVIGPQRLRRYRTTPAMIAFCGSAKQALPSDGREDSPMAYVEETAMQHFWRWGKPGELRWRSDCNIRTRNLFDAAPLVHSSSSAMEKALRQV